MTVSADPQPEPTPEEARAAVLNAIKEKRPLTKHHTLRPESLLTIFTHLELHESRHNQRNHRHAPQLLLVHDMGPLTPSPDDEIVTLQNGISLHLLSGGDAEVEPHPRYSCPEA